MKIADLGKLHVVDAYNAIVNAEPGDAWDWKNKIIREVNKLLSVKEPSVKVTSLITAEDENEIILFDSTNNSAKFELVIVLDNNYLYARDGTMETSFEKRGSLYRDFEVMLQIGEVVKRINEFDLSLKKEIYKIVQTGYNQHKASIRVFYYKKLMADTLNTAEKKGNFRLFLKELGKYYDADAYYHKRRDLLQSYNFYTEELESIMTDLAGYKFKGKFDFVWSEENTDKSMFFRLQPKNANFAELFSNFIFKCSIAVVNGGDKYTLKNSYFRGGFSGTFKQTAGISKEEASYYFDAMEDFLSNVTIEKLQEKLAEFRFADKRNFIRDVEFHKCLGLLLKSIREINENSMIL